MLPYNHLNGTQVALSSPETSSVLFLYVLPNCFLAFDKCTVTASAGTLALFPVERKKLLLRTAGIKKTDFHDFIFSRGKNQGKKGEIDQRKFLADNKILDGLK